MSRSLWLFWTGNYRPFAVDRWYAQLVVVIFEFYFLMAFSLCFGMVVKPRVSVRSATVIEHVQNVLLLSFLFIAGLSLFY